MSIATLPVSDQGTTSLRPSGVRSLSPMQAGMLAETLLAPQPGVNIVQIVVRYGERVDAEAMRRAWQLAVESFATFRTDFAWREGSPSQSVHPSAEIPWEELAVDSPETLSDEAFRAWLGADRARGIALDQAPLTRVTLARLPSGDCVVWTLHHILLDGNSYPTVLQGVGQAYRMLREGRAAGPLAGADFRKFLDWLEVRDAHSDRQFWFEYLKGIEAATPLFEARERRDESAVNACLSVTQHLGGEVYEALRAVARRFDVTLGTIVQGAWGLLACRQLGVPEAMFGVTRSGRHFSTGAEDIVGLLINTVPVRVKASPDATVESWLKSLRQDTLSIRTHEATPLIDVQAVSEIPRGEPLFKSLVLFEGITVEQRLAALDEIWKTRNIEIIGQSSFPLVLTAQVSDGLALELNYDPGIFERDTIERSLAQLSTLLESIARKPDGLVDQLAWIPVEEKEKIEAFNGQVLINGEFETIVSLFEEVVSRTPDAEAVVAPDGRLTYAELNQRANRLANYLVEKGVKRGDAVAIVLERTTDLIVAVWAVLKSGAAYLPIDTFYPKERIQAVADASNFNLMITLSRLKNTLPKSNAELLFLDELGPTLAELSPNSPGIALDSNDPAYFIFTSGTTGKPKGVRTVHGNVMSMYRAWEEAYRLDTLRAHLQFASPSFDVFSGELVRAHCAGLKLVMCPHEYTIKPQKLYELLRDEAVDIAEFVPLVLRSLIDHLEREGLKLETMRLVCVGADVWYVHELERVRSFLPDGARLINSYGISETTIDSTYFEGDVSHLPQAAGVPIGRPFPNTSVYVLDEKLRPVPIGVVGEIFIGGYGVTPGYVNDDERTKERFMADPFRNTVSARMYKSGDLGRFRADGTIELVGRSDHQVKVRGFRIEIGEVETALGAHPDVSQGVVVTQARGVGEKRLVGYFTTRDGKEVDTRKLRAFLGDRLPYYMVPAVLVHLPDIPRSPNGKVDRKALPIPENLELDLQHRYEAPRDDLEARLCEIWSEVLGIQRIGVNDDFFEIGGHSLLAVSIFAKIEASIGQELPITALFEGRTIARMAAGLREGKKNWSNIVDLGGEGTAPPLFWLHTLGGGGGGGFFRYETVIKQLNVPRRSYGIRAPAVPLDRIDKMAARYVDEMRRVQPKGPYHLLGYCFGGIVAYEMAEQLHRVGEKVDLLCLIEAPAQIESPKPWSSFKNLLWFLRNALEFMLGFFAWPSARQREWVTRQIRVLGARIFKPKKSVYTLNDYLEMHEHRAEYRRYVEAHWEALQHYDPNPHPGRALVLRVRGQNLELFEPDLGWGRLCERGVDVEVLTGLHEDIFDEPHLGRMARTIKRYIPEAEIEAPVERKSGIVTRS